jgi:hypothetical protein
VIHCIPNGLAALLFELLEFSIPGSC